MATRAHASLGRAGVAVWALAAALSGCSILFHVDANQCATSGDCAAHGLAFSGFTCSQGTCIAPPETSTQCRTNADCASRGAGYTCTQGACVAPIAMSDGGTEAAVEAEAGPPQCTTNMDCQGTQNHPEAVCDVDRHTCLQLTSDECPVLIPSDTSKLTAAPIFVGAFMTIPLTSGPLTHPSYLNYNLALTEFQRNGGIPAGPGNGLRMPFAVGCDVGKDIDLAMKHLINEVHVPAIVAPLPAATLSQIFSTYAEPDKNDIFIINPFSADPTLAVLSTGGLMWHMLGQPGDDAPAYAAFLPLVENYIRTRPPWNFGPTAPIKVATVTASATATNDLAKAAKAVLTWNGGQSSTNDSANYLSVGISDSTLNGTLLNGADTASMNLIASIKAAEQQILNFAPQVVISFASEEFTKLTENVEIDWNSPLPPPFYLLGPYNQGSTLLQADVPTTSGKNTRFAGIGVASTTDSKVLSDYNMRFLTAYIGRTDALNYENYYDAMYFTVYSLIAAGRNFPNGVTGGDLARGMLNLISLTSPTPFSVGPDDMGNIFSALSQHGTIELIGTLGPPDFDPRSGSRIGAGDVYCFANTEGGTPAFSYDYDVLRLQADGGAPLQGTFPCFPGIQ
jgi:hypothetical protein